MMALLLGCWSTCMSICCNLPEPKVGDQQQSVAFALR